MQLTTIFGLILGIGAIVIGNVLEGGGIQSLFQLTAFFIVFGGTIGATIVSNRLEDIRLALNYTRMAFASSETEERERVAKEIITASQLVRRESILALEPMLSRFSDPFMRSVYRFVIDGVESSVLRQIFEDEIEVSQRRKLAAAKVWSDAGGFAPTIGIIGAVLGLISVMTNIADTALLGQGIAVAFVATIYGVGSANILFIPLSNKLKALIRYRAETEQMILEGALSVVNGLNPYLIEQKMRAFTVEVSAP